MSNAKLRFGPTVLVGRRLATKSNAQARRYFRVVKESTVPPVESDTTPRARAWRGRARRWFARGAAVVALLAVAAVLFFLTGCAGVDKAQLAAFEEYHQATAPEYVEYVKADAKLTNEQKERRFRTVDRAQSAIDRARGKGK